MVILTYLECAILMNCLISYKPCNTVPLKCTGTILYIQMIWNGEPHLPGVGHSDELFHYL